MSAKPTNENVRQILNPTMFLGLLGWCGVIKQFGLRLDCRKVTWRLHGHYMFSVASDLLLAPFLMEHFGNRQSQTNVGKVQPVRER
jgi:hypothetical protein